jgi:hypothetical protein
MNKAFPEKTNIFISQTVIFIYVALEQLVPMFDFMKNVAKNTMKWKKYANIKQVPAQPTLL